MSDEQQEKPPEREWPPNRVWVPVGTAELAAVSLELENVEGDWWIRESSRADIAPEGDGERVAKLEQIAEGLRSLDWVAGYALTTDQHLELDALRAQAFDLLEPKGTKA